MSSVNEQTYVLLMTTPHTLPSFKRPNACFNRISLSEKLANVARLTTPSKMSQMRPTKQPSSSNPHVSKKDPNWKNPLGAATALGVPR